MKILLNDALHGPPTQPVTVISFTKLKRRKKKKEISKDLEFFHDYYNLTNIKKLVRKSNHIWMTIVLYLMVQVISSHQDTRRGVGYVVLVATEELEALAFFTLVLLHCLV